MAGQLVRNAIRCNACGDVIESHSLHDRVLCRCGQASVDGGLIYARRTYHDVGFTELAEYEPDGGS